MVKVIDLKKYKKEKKRNRTKTFFERDYKPGYDSCNDDSYGTVCVKCGRKFLK